MKDERAIKRKPTVELAASPIRSPVSVAIGVTCFVRAGATATPTPCTHTVYNYCWGRERNCLNS